MPPAAEKHPHADRPSAEQLGDLLKDHDPAVRDAYLALHALIVDALPDIEYSTDLTDAMTGYGQRQYGYDGWGMAAVGANRRWASLMLFRGAHLPDPSGILEGSGKNMRHVKVRSLEQFEERRDAIRALVDAAAKAAA
jgi:hypothetical protein